MEEIDIKTCLKKKKLKEYQTNYRKAKNQHTFFFS